MSWPDLRALTHAVGPEHAVRTGRPRGRPRGPDRTGGIMAMIVSPYEARKIEALALPTSLSGWARDAVCAALGIENTLPRHRRHAARRLGRVKGRPQIGFPVSAEEEALVKAAASGRPLTRWLRLCARAALGLRVFWSPEEDDPVFCGAWWRADADGLRRAFPGATERALAHRATSLGLTGGAPSGYVSIEGAMRLAGYSKETTHKILVAAGVKAISRRGAGPGRHRYVRVVDVTRAVALWQSRETLAAAAVRVCVPRNTLERWMLAAGHANSGTGCHWRVAPSVVDAVVATHRGLDGRVAA